MKNEVEEVQIGKVLIKVSEGFKVTPITKKIAIDLEQIGHSFVTKK